MRTAVTIFVGLALLVTSEASKGRVVWVRTNGNDTLGCGTDAQPCRSVQFAVNLAAAGDTVLLASPAFRCELPPNGVSVTKTLSFVALSPPVTFDCFRQGRAFWVRDASVSFSGISISRGFAPNAGAVLIQLTTATNFMTIAFSNCWFINNGASTAGAGAVSVWFNGRTSNNNNTVLLSNSHFIGNSIAPSSPSAAGFRLYFTVGAGGSSNWNVFRAVGTVFQSNTGRYPSGGVCAGGVLISSSTPSTRFQLSASFDHCLFEANSLNRTRGFSGNGFAAAGALLQLTSFASPLHPEDVGSTVSFASCVFLRNQLGILPDNKVAAAILVQLAGGALSPSVLMRMRNAVNIVNSSFVANGDFDCRGVCRFTSYVSSSAVLLSATTTTALTIRVDHCTFLRQNMNASFGSLVFIADYRNFPLVTDLLVSSSRFADNEGSCTLFISSGPESRGLHVRIVDSVFERNRGSASLMMRQGPDCFLTVLRSAFVDNLAVDVGAIKITLEVDHNYQNKIIDSLFAGNVAFGYDNPGGLAREQGLQQASGAILQVLIMALGAVTSADNRWELVGSVFQDNVVVMPTTKFSGAGAFSLFQSSNFQSRTSGNDSVLVDSCWFVRNFGVGLSTTAGAIWLGLRTVPDRKLSAVVLRNTVFDGNAAKPFGAVGVIGHPRNIRMSVTGCDFIGNEAVNSIAGVGTGGALSVVNVQLTVTASRFWGNQADVGGALFLDNALFTGSRLQMANNSASGPAQAIYSIGGTMSLTNSNVSLPLDSISVVVASGKGMAANRIICPIGARPELINSSVVCKLCPDSTFLLEQGHWDGQDSLSVCLPCPFGASCAGGSAVTVTRDRWAATIANELFVSECPRGLCCASQSSCALDKICRYESDSLPFADCLVLCCSNKRTGPLCSQCWSGYSEAFGSTECRANEHCNDLASFILLALCVGFAYAAYLLFRDLNSDGLITSLLYFYQLLPAFFVGKQSFSTAMLLLTDLAHIQIPTTTADSDVDTNANSGSHSLSLCPFPGMTLLQKHFSQLLSPVVIVVPLFVLFGLAGLWERFAATRKHASKTNLVSSRARMAAALVATVLLTFSSVVTAVSIALHCVPLNGFAGRVLFEAAYVQCYQPWQYLFFVLIVLVVAFPFALAWFTVRLRPAIARSVFRDDHHDDLSESANDEQPEQHSEPAPSSSQSSRSSSVSVFVMLSSAYRSKTAWWESVLLLQRLAVVLIVTFVGNAVARLLLLLFLTSAMLLAHVTLRPYAHSHTQRAQGGLLLLLVLTAAINIPQATLLENASSAAAATSSVIDPASAALSLFMVAPAVFLVVYLFVEQLRKRCKRCKSSRSLSELSPSLQRLAESPSFDVDLRAPLVMKPVPNAASR